MKNELDNFKKIWDNAPSPICVVEGPNHHYAYVNKAHKALHEGQEFLNHPIKEVLPELTSQGFIDIMDKVYATGKAYQGEEVPVVFSNNKHLTYYFNFIYQPLSDDNGDVYGIFIQLIDITKQVELRKDKEILLEELNHRVRNNLAIITGIIDMQVQDISNDECLHNLKDTRKRVGTFTNVHELIFGQSDLKNIPFHDLLQKISEQCRLYDHPHFKISVNTDDLFLNINQAIPLGLICNEMLSWFKNRVSSINEIRIESELTNHSDADLIFILDRISNDKEHLLWDNTSFEGRLINILARQVKAKIDAKHLADSTTVHVRFTKADISGSGASRFL